MVLTDDQLEYAALDVLHLHQLMDKQLEAIASEQLESVLDLENRLVPVVVEMEDNGFRINRDRLVGLMEDYAGELEEASAVLRDELGNNINPNSPKQLKEALNKKGLGLANTSERTLKQSGHSLASCILNYRSAKKQMEQAETILKERSVRRAGGLDRYASTRLDLIAETRGGWAEAGRLPAE